MHFALKKNYFHHNLKLMFLFFLNHFWIDQIKQPPHKWLFSPFLLRIIILTTSKEIYYEIYFFLFHHLILDIFYLHFANTILLTFRLQPSPIMNIIRQRALLLKNMIRLLYSVLEIKTPLIAPITPGTRKKIPKKTVSKLKCGFS